MGVKRSNRDRRGGATTAAGAPLPPPGRGTPAGGCRPGGARSSPWSGGCVRWAWIDTGRDGRHHGAWRGTTAPVDAEELIALGVYDPEAANADVRLALLEYVTGLGASAEELVTFEDTLPALAGVLAIRGGPALTLEQVAERSGRSPEEVRSLARTSGIPDPEPDVPVFTEAFVTF